jgi:hypothetical protein
MIYKWGIINKKSSLRNGRGFLIIGVIYFDSPIVRPPQVNLLIAASPH